MIYSSRKRIKKEALELQYEIQYSSLSASDDELLKELGQLINHLSYIARKGDEFLLQSAKIALSSLLRTPPHVVVAK